MLKFSLFALVILIAGCAQMPQPDGGKATTNPSVNATTLYQQGLARYRDSRFDLALGDLNTAVASNELGADEVLNARKHIAFIHCINQRETQCREQFQAILKIDSKFELPANEIGHPAWGPVWRSVKGTLEEQQALARSRGLFASSAQQKLVAGKEAYDAGRYNETIDALQTAIKSGRLNHTDQIIAHKYSAFAYCLTKRRDQCRGEFRSIFALDPSFELLASEIGHPVWKAIYAEEHAAAKRKKPDATKK